MVRAISEKVGPGPCPDCGAGIVFRKSSGGMLTHKCDHCDSSGYAQPGGTAYAKRMATIATKATAPAAEPPAATPATTPPPPAQKKRINSAFSLGDL